VVRSPRNCARKCQRRVSVHIAVGNFGNFSRCFCDKQEGDDDFSQISSEENDFQLDDELPSNIVSFSLFK